MRWQQIGTKKCVPLQWNGGGEDFWSSPKSGCKMICLLLSLQYYEKNLLNAFNEVEKFEANLGGTDIFSPL